MSCHLAALLLALTPVLSACSLSTTSGPSGLSSPIAVLSSPPYTAAQLHAACGVGRLLDFRVEARGQPVVHRVMEFVGGDDERALVETRVTDDAGRELAPPSRAEASWEELQRHGQFPAEQLTITTGTASTPAGDFACHVYTVRAPGAVHTFYFADALPGPPVLFFTDDGRGRLMTTTLVRSMPAANR
jgi:hypothetical protein